MNSQCAIHQSRTRGFTLLELLATVSILGVLLAVGVPSFNEAIRNNRTASQANELVTALNIARSEASKRGLPVVVCAADNVTRTACAPASTGNWSNGWMVFLDRSGTAGDFDGIDEVLQVSSSTIPATLQLTTNNAGLVRYARSGTITNAGAVSFGLQHSGCTGANRRTITIDLTGRINLTKGACT